MIEFFAAIVVFLALHSLPAATGLRAVLIDRIGRRTYLTLYSLVSVLALVWLVSATLRAPRIWLWPPNEWTAAVPLVVMLPACVLIAGAITRANPLSVSFRGGAADTEQPGVLGLVRHPILWAFCLWATSHATANGDVVAVIMFGGLALFSLAGMKLFERRARARLPASEFGHLMSVARGRFSNRVRASLSLTFAIEIVGGCALYVIALLLHAAVIGADPLGMWR